MSDEPRPGTQLAPQPRRPITPVQDLVPMFDTARFEHYGRIAAVMAGAQLVPDGLRNSASDCFMVVSLADRLGFDPFAVAQCCSLVHGKLMLEGKLVHAAIQNKLGHDLHFHFTGEKGKDTYRVYVSDKEFDEEIVARLTPGGSYIGWRIIDGSVGEWKTFEKGGAVKDNWVKQPDMQLRYRGSRTWSRAYEPGIMLGVYVEDEFDEIIDRRETAARLSGPSKLTAGFGDDTDKNFRTAPETPTGAPGEASAASGSTTADDPAARTEPPSGADGGGKSPPQVQDAEFEEGEAHEEGHAAADEVYFLAGEEPGEGKRRQTYKNGEKFSTTGKREHKVYAEHPPAPEAEGAEGGAKGEPNSTSDASTGTSSSGSASETDSTGAQTSATGTSGDDFPGDRPAPGAQAKEEPKKEAAKPEAPKPEAGGESNPFDACMERILAAGSWLTIKQHMRTLAKSEAWGTAEDEAKRMIRAQAWERFSELREEGSDKTDVIIDLSLFRLWVEFGARDSDEIDGLWRMLTRQACYREASESDRNAIGRFVMERRQQLAPAEDDQ